MFLSIDFMCFVTTKHVLLFLITLQTAIVIDGVQIALHVTMKMESATANQTFLVTSALNVLMDSMGSLIVNVGFSY